jgi:hypothetical protein
LDREPSERLLAKIGFRETEVGANLWLVVPNDRGVFQGSSERDGIQCVHPVQNYLDLQEHPERSREGAERLRDDILNWPDRG